ncbi:MAG: T9SS type A sorting domain-containing protein [bacterium]|nr:MAG: T9SS type A sorting domain-containing protein [bacterium]
MSHKIALYPSLLFIGIFAIYTCPAMAQFAVVSSFPSHGSSNVDPTTTLSFTFNSAIDTSARFQFPEDFYVNIYLYPDSLIGEPDSVTLSPDLTTFYAHNLHLANNTTYYFVIVDAVSTTGDSLQTPYPLLFTTGGSLPNSTVAGTINYPGYDPTGTLVALIDNNPFGFDSEKGEIVNGAIVSNGSGTYISEYVHAGIYWPVAIKDFYIAWGGTIEIYPGSAMGFYDPNGDHIPDSIVVSAGSQVTGINLNLQTIIQHTAREVFPQVQLAAQSWSSDARFVQLYCEPEPDGSGINWPYIFYSPSLADYQMWVSIGGILIQTDIQETLEDTLAIPDSWLDSDSVMAIAENHGGRDFRQYYPDTELSGFLGHFLGSENIKNSASLVSTIHFNETKSAVKHLADLPINPVSGFFNKTNSMRHWPVIWVIQYVSYVGGGDYLAIVIDALSGEVLSDPVTAGRAESAAFLYASEWSSDSKLLEIRSEWGSVDSTGKSNIWICQYYSSSKDSVYELGMQGMMPVLTGTTPWPPMDTTGLTVGWLDSDIAIAVAENQGGAAYRHSNQEVTVYASLINWFQGPNPELPIWLFSYTSFTAEPLVFIINAMTGTILDINLQQSPSIPDKFILYQNYPNPFNPMTNFTFYLPKSADVTLKIYNIIGEEVATLISGPLPSGSYTYKWDFSNLASGAYLYRLQAGEYIETRKMILMK